MMEDRGGTFMQLFLMMKNGSLMIQQTAETRGSYEGRKHKVNWKVHYREEIDYIC
jgi:hypothetical protein